MYYKFKHLTKSTENIWYSLPLWVREGLGISGPALTESILQHRSKILTQLFNIRQPHLELAYYILACSYWFNVIGLSSCYMCKFQATPTGITLSWERRPPGSYRSIQ
jgi:hypothetical protein